jgi:hypothetical protein
MCSIKILCNVSVVNTIIFQVKEDYAGLWRKNWSPLTCGAGMKKEGVGYESSGTAPLH